jgi:hypothetical protein
MYTIYPGGIYAGSDGGQTELFFETYSIVRLLFIAVLAGSLSDTASVKWVWEGQVTSDFIPSSYLSMWVEGDYVIVAYDRARVALINANTGASLFDVDTATVTPLLSESRKYQDNRVFPHPDGVHFYWLRCTISLPLPRLPCRFI